MTTINLTELFETQRKLDAEIERKHPPVDGEDRFAKKKLALLVEVGELANEQRTWKFWSEDKKPRIHKLKYNALNDDWKDFNPLLEEYVDCVHFILSIGNEYAEYAPGFYEEFDGTFNLAEGFTVEDIPEQINGIFYYASKLGGSIGREFYADIDLETYGRLFQSFIGLGEMLGFTGESVIGAYMSKNAINYQRQESGY